MAKKQTTPSASGPAGGSYPLPSFPNLTGGLYSKIEKLSKVQANLSVRSHRIAAEMRKLESLLEGRDV
jgi:hypothetical protein